MRGTVWDGLRSASPAWLRSWIKGQRWFIPISTRLFGNSVYSRGYYLDHANDPFTYYDADPQAGKRHLGCIACMWTELVSDRTIERTIFPQLYMIAHRWWTYPYKHVDPPVLLRQLCERYGYPPAELDDWRRRRWAGLRNQSRRPSRMNRLDTMSRPPII